MDSSGTHTSSTLLRQVAEGTCPASDRLFFERYSRLASLVTAASGIQSQDYEDIVQETMLAAMDGLKVGRYQRGKGAGFRAWFKGILRNKIYHAWRASDRSVSTMASLPDVADHTLGPNEIFEQTFEAQAREIALEEAYDQIREEVESGTWQAFDLVKRKAMKAREAAKLLGVSRRAVDLAVFRVKQRLSEKLGGEF